MIAPHTIAQICDRTDIVALVGDCVKLTRRGRSHVGLCPFHKEKTPSFHVNPERGYFHCFGCKEHGNAIDFVRKLEGKTFPEAVRALAERLGIEVEDNATEAERREAAAARRATDDLYAVNGLAATFFEHSLQGGPGLRVHPLARYAAEELGRRGLPLDGPPEVAAALQAFRIGYAPYAWDGLTSYLQKHGISPAQAERVGLLVPRSSGGGHYDRFRHRLMFAVLDVSGRVIAFSGRSLPEPAEGELAAAGLRPSNKPEEKPAKYINSPESPIYTKGEHLFGLYQARQAIRQAGEAVLVEGNFDVLSLHARGIQNVVAPLGTAFTEHQARLLKRFTPSVTLMLDGDAAGKKATWAARIPCRAVGLTARAADVPRGTDPDELAQKKDRDALLQLLSGAAPLTHRLLDWLLRDGEVEGAAVHDQAARARAAVKLIGESGDDIERATLRAYADQLAQALQVGGIAELEALVRRPARPASAPTAPRAAPFAEEMSLAMLGALLDHPALLDRPEVTDRLELMTGPAALAVVALRGEDAPDALIARVPEPVREYVSGRLATPLFDTEDEALRRLRHYARKIEATRPRMPAPEAA